MTWTPLSFGSGQILTANQMNNLQSNIIDIRGKGKGPTAPDSPVAGTEWLDDSATPWVWKVYDGTSWTPFAEVDTTTSETRMYNPLTVRNNSGTALVRASCHSDNSAFKGQMTCRKSRGTADTPTAIKSGDTIGAFTAAGHNASDFFTGGEMRFETVQDWSGSNMGTSFTLSLVKSGSVVLSEIMRVTDTANIEATGSFDALVNGSAQVSCTVAGDGANDFPSIKMRRSGGVTSSPTATDSGDQLGVLAFAGYNGDGGYPSGFSIKANAAHNYTLTQWGAETIFVQILSGSSMQSTLLTLTYDGGAVFGAPTGGSKGFGTVNAQAVYDDGALLTCYPLEYARTNSVDLTVWDNAVPQREGREVFEEIDGVEVRKRLPQERRVNTRARAFLQNADILLDPEGYAKLWQTQGHLPAFPSINSWEALSIGDISQRLWETVEIQAVHIAKLTARISSLEAGQFSKLN